MIPDDHPLLHLLPLVLEAGRRLERAQHGRAPRTEIHRPPRPLDLPRPGGARGPRLRQRRRGRRTFPSGPTPIPIRSASGWPPTSCWPWPPARPPKQQVMKMTQIIWYRSQTAPMPKPGEARPAFQARWEHRAARRPVHHHRAHAPARGLLDQDRPAHPRHHVPRLAVAGARRHALGGYRFTHRPDAARTGATGPRGDSPAGSHAARACRA